MRTTFLFERSSRGGGPAGCNDYSLCSSKGRAVASRPAIVRSGYPDAPAGGWPFQQMRHEAYHGQAVRCCTCPLFLILEGLIIARLPLVLPPDAMRPGTPRPGP